MIKEIKRAVTIPVMAKARIGHFVEAQILEACGIDYIDESEVSHSVRASLAGGVGARHADALAASRAADFPVQVLTPADDIHHINKHSFKVPFVCGCRDLGEALRRVAEGAAMIRTKVMRLLRNAARLCCAATDTAWAHENVCRPPPPFDTGQGEAGTGNVVEAVRHARAVQGAIRQLQTMDDDELYVYAKVCADGAGPAGRPVASMWLPLKKFA